MAGSKAERRPSPHRTGFILGALASIAGCGALAPLAVQFGADLISSASNNYSQQYAKQLEGLLLAVYQDKAAKKNQGQTTVAQAGPYPAYPGGQPYGGSPYPAQPDPYGQSGAYPAQTGGYPTAQPGAYPPQAGQPYGGSPYPSYPAQPDPYAQQAGGAYPQAGGAYPSSPGSQPYGSQPYGAPPAPQAGSPYPAYPSQPDPYAQPAGGAYPGAAYGQNAVPGSSIVMDATILAQRASDRAARRADPVPLQDGETLRDGGSDPRKGDVIKFSFRVNCDCYVYVIGADATGYVARIFPDAGSGLNNPVRANQQYVVPGGTAWYGLDQYKGVEQVFFIASRGPRKDIESPLSQLVQTARTSLTKNFRAVREAVQPGMRGLVKVQMPTQDTVQSESGQRFSFTPQAFAAQPGSDDVVITRWFNHE